MATKPITPGDIERNENRSLKITCRKPFALKAGVAINLIVENMGEDRWRLSVWATSPNEKLKQGEEEGSGPFELNPNFISNDFAREILCTLPCVAKNPVKIIRYFLLSQGQLEIRLDIDMPPTTSGVDLIFTCGNFTSMVTIPQKEALKFLEIKQPRN